MPYRNLFGAGICLLAVSAGCQAPSDTAARTTEPATEQAQNAFTTEDHRLSWSDLTLRPKGFDQLAEGPSAVAIAADGSTLLLDRLGGRIVAVGADGVARELATVDPDVEDIAVGPDGAIVAYSPLRAHAWIFEKNGTPAGDVSVPRTFRDVSHIGLDASRMVRLHTWHQETYTVGSPNAPQELPVAMRTKREGAYQLADGRGVATRVVDGKALLTVLRQPQGRERTSVLAKHVIPGEVTAARVVGVQESIACMRVEQVTSTPATPKLSVSRRAVCMSVATGDVTLDIALPSKGNYVPRRELAMGNGSLAFIHPAADGLAVQRWRIEGSKEVAK